MPARPLTARHRTRRLLRRGALAVVATLALGAFWERDETARELGQVRWERDHDAALARARSAGVPVFAFFQEVPGCATCVGFGEQVLSHPLLVEAIEEHFVPLLVYNNRPGRDAELLARYGEPSWNNPVVRFLDGEGEDLLPRRAGVWTPHAVGERMLRALEIAGRPVPAYLRDAVDEVRPRNAQRATLGMACYWSGEACLGGIDGVLASRTGSLGGAEVVEVTFDGDAVAYGALLAEARRRGCATRAFAHDGAQLRSARAVFGDRVRLERGALRPARDRDQKYYLRGSRLADVALTPRQAMRVNAALASKRDPSLLLSPRQASPR